MNKQQVFEEKIAPILDGLRKVCYQEKIPMFAAFAVADDGVRTSYQNEILSPGTLSLSLTDDKLAQFICVIQGYRTIAPEDEVEIHSFGE